MTYTASSSEDAVFLLYEKCQNPHDGDHWKMLIKSLEV